MITRSLGLMRKTALAAFLLSTCLHAQWMIGVYSSGNGTLPYSAIPWSKYTHIIDFAAAPDQAATGNVELHWLTQSDITQFINSRPAGKKAIVCIKDNDFNLNAMPTNTSPALINTFVSNIANFVKTNGFDGVDIDWEANVNTTQYTQLLSLLRAAMPNAVIMADMGNWGGLPNVASASQSYVDRINLGCYDMDNPGNGYSWYNGALFQNGNPNVATCDWRVSAFTSVGVANSKLSIGLPFYGRRWPGVLQALVNGSFSPSTVYYNQLVTDSTRWQPQYQYYDNSYRSNYLSIPSMDEFDSFTGTQEVQDAAAWIKSKGLGGALTFTLEYEYLTGQSGDAQYPLSTALANAMGGTTSNAPVVSGGSPSGTLATSTTQTTMSVVTDISATCKYATTAGTAYASMPYTFAITGGTSHSSTMTGLTSGSSYTYYVRCSNTSGVADTSDYTVSFKVAQPAPPVISAGAPTGTLPSGTTQATMSASTNVNSTCKYSTAAGTAYSSMPYTFASTGGTSQSTTLTGLTSGSTYSYYLRCSNVATGDVDASDYVVSFAVASSGIAPQPPVVSGGSPSGSLASSTTQTAMSAATNENATCKYATAAGTAYTSMPYTFSTTGGTSHSSMMTGLTSGSSYNYYVRCADSTGNADTTDYPISFSIAQGTTPPATPVAAVSPNTGSGSSQIFTYQVTDGNGYGTLVELDTVVGPLAASSCRVQFDSPNTLWLQSDDLSTWSSGTMGSTATLKNSQCTVNLAGASVSGSGYVTNVAIPLTFASGYAGTKSILALAADSKGAVENWTIVGSWTVPSTVIAPPPVVSGGSPSGILGSSTTQTTMSVTTNENATCKYATAAGTAYASMPYTFATTGGTTSSTTLTGLTSGSSYNYYVRCADSSGNADTTDYPISFSIAQATVPPATPVTTVNPNTGSGLTQTFTFSVTDGNGYGSLSELDTVFGNTVGSTYSCRVQFDAPNMLWLQSDDTTTWSSGTMGSAATLKNSQCTVNLAGSSVSGSGYVTNVAIALTFAPGYSGTKSIWALTADSAGAVANWATLGSWTIPTAVQASLSVAVSPNAGSGTSQTFSIAATDTNGYASVSQANVVFGTQVGAASSCYVQYTPSTKTLSLANNANTGSTSAVLGTSTTLQNSQCTVNARSATVSGAGSTLTLHLPMTFSKNGYKGARTIYTFATDQGGTTTGWLNSGSWNVQ